MFNVEPQEPWSREDSEEFETYAAAQLKKMLITATWAGVALILNIACVLPFLYGWPLHHYWDKAGKYLLLTSMAFFVWFVMRAGFVWSSWQSARETRREFGDPQ
jgi:hypothetical protein